MSGLSPLWRYVGLISCLVFLLSACAGAVPEGTMEPTGLEVPRVGTATPTSAVFTPTSLERVPSATSTSQAGTGDRGIRPTPATPPGGERVPASEATFVTGEVPEELLAAVLDDAMERSGRQREEIEVVRAEEVVWKDGALGCPQPGMMYTMGLVQGYWVVLEVDGEEYDYRLVRSGRFMLCEGDKFPLPSQ